MQTVKDLFFRIVVILIFGGISACSSAPTTPSGPPTPTTIQPTEGKGGVRGVATNTADLWKDSKVIYVFAAEFHGDDQGKGIYVLEPSIHPHTKVEAGSIFQINDMPPGEYVLVFGPSPEGALIYRQDGEVQVIKVLENEVTDVGNLVLAW